MATTTLGPSYFNQLLQEPIFAPGQEMKFEAARLQSFAYWTSYDQASPIFLAKAGFFYTGDSDNVKCHVCHIIKGNWNRNMNPTLIHRDLSPDCRFCQSFDGVNIPIFVPQQSEYDGIQQILHRKYCGSDTPAFFSTGISHRSVDNSANATASFRQNQTQTNFPVMATDAGAPETSRQAIGVQGALGRGHDSEAAPTREEFAPMKQESNRFSTFDSTWPTQETPDPRDLARAGFYYTGTVDRVQCGFCRGILRNWDEDDVPMEQHRRHFPMCPFVMGLDVGNMPDPTAIIAASTTGEVFRVTQPSAVVSDASLGIITERPKHAQYAVEAARITSFRNWSSGKEQTPETLAKAGFFYAGFGDSVKCFFCDGGLRTWERADVPWIEHARWYPHCPYVRQVKGEDFIQSARQDHETPLFTHGAPSTTPRTTESSHSSMGKKNHTVDPRELSARMDSTVVQSVLSLDFPKEKVAMAIKNRLQETGDDFPSVAALVEAIYKLTEKNPSQEPTGASSNTMNFHADAVGVKGAATEDVVMTDDDNESQSLLKENEELKEQRRCKICMDADVNVVFLPCAHLVCCVSCAPAVRKCPVCRSVIKGTVRTFMS